jgi:hypothetical protein
LDLGSRADSTGGVVEVNFFRRCVKGGFIFLNYHKHGIYNSSI